MSRARQLHSRRGCTKIRDALSTAFCRVYVSPSAHEGVQRRPFKLNCCVSVSWSLAPHRRSRLLFSHHCACNKLCTSTMRRRIARCHRCRGRTLLGLDQCSADNTPLLACAWKGEHAHLACAIQIVANTIKRLPEARSRAGPPMREADSEAMTRMLSCYLRHCAMADASSVLCRQATIAASQ